MSESQRGDSAAHHPLALPQAIAEQRLMLYYQPIVHMPSGRVLHYEALLRLRDQEGRIVAPPQFLPAVSAMGLAAEFTEWVLRSAIQELKEKRQIKIDVNLFSECIGNPKLLQFVRTMISGIEPGRLGFEMAEDTVVADISNTAEWIMQLRDTGCRFAIDDFGAGNTATVVLVNLPVDCVKIDGSLVTALTSDPEKHSLVKAVSTMASAQKKTVVAEWVESEAIAAELLNIGIENGQGYYFGHPGPRLPKRMGRRRAVAAIGRAAT